MHDDGTNGDADANDGVYTGTIPAQPNRSIVRYRITAKDNANNSIRAPFPDDSALNFATFVYNGVPDYQGIPSATLTKLPTYHWITRKADYDQCVAYDSTNQLSGGTAAWTFENWEGALVFDGKVYDHIHYRLHGGNGRYYFTSKRAFRFFFNPGYDFQNRDNDGNLYPVKWNSMTTENLWENRGTLTYSLNEIINFYLFNLVGVPGTNGNYGHWRLIDYAAEQQDAYHGDFWGLIFLHEDYDRRFIDSHNLLKGNLYKLSRDDNDGPSQQRYQAPDAVSDGSDYNNIQNLLGSPTDAFIGKYVNVDRWTYFQAISQGVRNYDFWPTGDNNGCYYFTPDTTDPTNIYGKMWILPSDVDATWGPTWNEGKDIVYGAVIDGGHTTFYPQYYNAVREVRDLLFQHDQIDPLIDQFASIITNFVAADSIRWKNAPDDAGNYNGLGGAGSTSLTAYVADMKKFMWTGGSWPGGDVQSGGQSAFLDTLQASNGEGSKIPATPTITYTGSSDHSINSLAFHSTAFSDPQGSDTFGAIQWRVAEVTDPTAPAYVATDKLKMEWTASYDTGALTTFGADFTFPSYACKAGHAYRARVRHQDNTGRWSHWSAPIQFIAGNADAGSNTLVIDQFLYKPTAPTAAEITAGFTDADSFEFIELKNIGTQTINIGGLQFTKGITYTFPTGTTLAAGAYVIVASNADAFTFRYGAGKPVIGTYSGNLKNSGEEVTLTSSDGTTPIVDFTFSDSAPWPTEADTGGYSLVLINPDTAPDPNVATNWRASRMPGGSPGASDTISYAQWAAGYGGLGSQTDDPDHDSLSNYAEYIMGTSPLQANSAGLANMATSALQNLTVGGTSAQYLTVTFRKQVGNSDLTYTVEFSGDMSTWAANGVLVSSTLNGDGTSTEIWRSSTPVSSLTQLFGRLRVAP